MAFPNNAQPDWQMMAQSMIDTICSKIGNQPSNDWGYNYLRLSNESIRTMRGSNERVPSGVLASINLTPVAVNKIRRDAFESRPLSSNLKNTLKKLSKDKQANKVMKGLRENRETCVDDYDMTTHVMEVDDQMVFPDAETFKKRKSYFEDEKAASKTPRKDYFFRY